MNQGWVEKELDEVCTLQRGFDLPKKDRIPGAIPLMSASGRIDSHADAKVKGPGVVTGRSGSIGGVFYVEEDFWPLNTTLYVKNFHGNDPRFVFYLLSSFNLARFTSGAGVPTLNRNSVHKEIVKVPLEIKEQKRIVAILDESFAGIEKAVANTEKNFANARELFEGYLNSVFSQLCEGWEEKTIADIAEVKGGKRVPKGYKLKTEPTNYPYITVAAFNDKGGIDPSGVKYIDDDIYRQIRRYTISPDDLYISIAGTIGKSGIIPDYLDGANLTENACRLIFKNDIYNKYIYFFTKSFSFLEQATRNTRIAAQPKLALTRLKTIKIPIPSLEVQQKIVNGFCELLTEVERLESIYQQKLTALNELKQSLLQKAFSGELTAKDNNTAKEAAA